MILCWNRGQEATPERHFTMGDTLTGVIGAMAAQGMSPSSSAAVGVYLHGLAGDLAAETTAVGYRVTDLARLLPKARAQITEMDE